MDLSDSTLREALAAYPLPRDPSCRPLGEGLINETFLVEAGDERIVLQRLNPIFDPGIHHNIEAVTQRLREGSVETPELLRTTQGRLWTELPDGSVWRAQSYLAGHCRARVESPADAFEAAQLLARFHGALEGLDHDFVGLRLGVHDLAGHLTTLESALVEHRAHQLHDAIAALAEEILEAGRALPPIDGLPLRPVHGDPKFSNVLFAESGADAGRARAMVDLDTVAPLPLMVELGDAWRSWCNPAGEEEGGVPELDLDSFRASVAGYRAGRSFEPTAEERESLVGGVERISLELASRFAADVLRESYFGWDASRFDSAGAHHLERARGQWALFRSAERSRGERERILKKL